MDPFVARSVLANTEDLAKWCGQQAVDLDPLIATAELRPLSPAEARRVLLAQRELFVRISQQQTFLAEMVFHRAAPWWVWWRALLWKGLRGMGWGGKR